jgi:hypothetical protein
MELDKNIPAFYKPTGFYTSRMFENGLRYVSPNNHTAVFFKTNNIRIDINSRISPIDIVTKILIGGNTDNILLFSQYTNDNYSVVLLSCRYCDPNVVSVLISNRIHYWKECNSFGCIEEYFYLAAERRDDNVEIMDILITALRKCTYYVTSFNGLITTLNILFQCQNVNTFKYLYGILSKDFSESIYNSHYFDKKLLWFGKNIEIIQFLIDNNYLTTQNIIDGVQLNRDPEIINLMKEYISSGKLNISDIDSIFDEKID